MRPKDSPQDAIYHDTNMTEILYILKGSATLITGGTIPDARPPARPGGNYTGTKIDGGTSRHVVPGDVIITPGRTPLCHFEARPQECLNRDGRLLSARGHRPRRRFSSE